MSPESSAGQRRLLLLLLALLAVAVRLQHLSSVAATPLALYHKEFLDSDMHVFEAWAQRIVAGDLLGRETYHPVHSWQLAAAPPESWREWYGERPVFFKAPFYAYLVALSTALFGAAFVPMGVLQALAAVVSMLLLHRVTQRIFGEPAAWVAALLFAVYGPDVHYTAVLLRGPWIVLVALLVTWRLAETPSTPSLGASLALGVALGAALVVNEAFVSLPPLVLAVLALRNPRASAIGRAAAGLLAGLLATLSPLILRNLAVGAPPLSLAVTAGLGAAVYNASATNPYILEARAEVFAPLLEAGRGTTLGVLWECLRSFDWDPGRIGLFYARKLLGLLVPFESPDNVSLYYAALKSPLLGLLPGHAFVAPCAVVGLALARGRDLRPLLPAAASLLVGILFTNPASRYRATLAVFVLPVAAWAVVRVATWLRRGLVRPALAAAAGFALVFGAAQLVQARDVFEGRPAGLYRYRRVEFQLGAIIRSRQGRHDEAAAELLQLARLNPDRAVRSAALLDAARFRKQAGDAGGARELAALAAETSPRDPAAVAAAGDVVAELGDAEGAAALYARALGLGPQPALAERLAARLAAVRGARETESP